MSRLAGLVLGVVASAGCSAAPRAERPLGPVVNLVVDDERPASWTGLWGAGDVLIYVVPILPWWIWRDDPLPQRSLAPELRQAVEDSRLFSRVLGPGDPWPERLAAPYTLRVVLVESEVHRWRTTYGLGVAGLLLHALGAPQDYERASIALRATCSAIDGLDVHEGDGSASEWVLSWIYEGSMHDESEANLRHAVRAALSEALAPLLEPD